MLRDLKLLLIFTINGKPVTEISSEWNGREITLSSVGTPKKEG